MNQLDNLKKFSTIVADTGDVNDICRYNIQHATTNPSLILKAPLFTTYAKLFEDSLVYAQKKGGGQDIKLTHAADRLIVNIGSKILEHISGNISTEIDARLSFNSDLTVKKAHKIIEMYQEKNVDISRVLIKIAATWDGIKAAEILEQSGIKCNLTLVFSFAQARACAESKVHLVSPFVGRIYDWYHKHDLLKKYCIDNDPGVMALKKIFHYYKQYHYNTIIMGASFRSIEQILSVSGCDYLTISPNLLKELSNNTQSITRCLSDINNKICKRPIPISKENFLLEHNQNQMAVDKLNEGIHLFSIDQKRLEDLLIKQL